MSSGGTPISPTKSSRKTTTIPGKPTAIFPGRDGLGAYIASPSSFPSSRVIYYNDNLVAIHDMFPKSSIHLLLIPRDEAYTRLHPFEAFEDAGFLTKVKEEAQNVKTLAAAELRRMFGGQSTLERARREAMDRGDEELPRGRDWGKEIMVGVHAHPSMSHLHIHVISKDRISECMKHRKHYNSFATPFLVPLEDFPLADRDVRRHPGKEGYLEEDLRCWRCGKGFGNSFKKLKSHLEEEFGAWKRE